MGIALPRRLVRLLKWLNGEQLKSGKFVVPTQDLPVEEPEDLAAAEGKGMGN